MVIGETHKIKDDILCHVFPSVFKDILITH